MPVNINITSRERIYINGDNGQRIEKIKSVLNKGTDKTNPGAEPINREAREGKKE